MSQSSDWLERGDWLTRTNLKAPGGLVEHREQARELTIVLKEMSKEKKTVPHNIPSQWGNYGILNNIALLDGIKQALELPKVQA